MHDKLNNITFFEKITASKNILIAGIGGGFDIFAGLPLYFNLKKQGKNSILANLSFTDLHSTTSEMVHPYCYKIRVGDSDRSGRNYFPERHLKTWLGLQSENVTFYAFEKTGVQPLKAAYQHIIRQHDIDTIILIDGGTDALMFGDEEGMGTPAEDICSIAAAYQTELSNIYLLCVGFGIDHFHGVSHYRFLENVAKLIRDKAYLGLFQLTNGMEEFEKYADAIKFVNQCMIGKESIVSNCIISAIEGQYGDYHATSRTSRSELWINPLMSIYWCFELEGVVKNIKYFDKIKEVYTIEAFTAQLTLYRKGLSAFRAKKQMPI